MEAVTAALFGTAANAATGAAATAGLIGAGGKLTFGGLLGAGLSLASAGLSLGGAIQQSRLLASQAEWSRFQAGQEVLRGEQEANRVREALIRTLAANNAARGAAGIDLSGSPETLDLALAEQAERELAVLRDNAALRAAQSRASADLSRLQGRAALLGGIGSAAGSLFRYAERRQLIG